jgi:hypothetical protein
MAIYRFRIIIEDHEDVFREIEIKSTQTFADLHNKIQEAFKFDNSQLASFYMSDDSWRKGNEITLMDMSEGDDEKTPTMADSVLADFIDDPHQKIIYIFDFLAMWTFYLELVKIGKDDPKISYPQIVRSVGVAPKQHKTTTAPPVGDEEDDEPKKKGGIFDLEEVYVAEGEESEEDEFGEKYDEGTEGGLEEKGFHEEDF